MFCFVFYLKMYFINSGCSQLTQVPFSHLQLYRPRLYHIHHSLDFFFLGGGVGGCTNILLQQCAIPLHNGKRIRSLDQTAREETVSACMRFPLWFGIQIFAILQRFGNHWNVHNTTLCCQTSQTFKMQTGVRTKWETEKNAYLSNVNYHSVRS